MGKKESPLGELKYNDDICKEIDKVKRKYSLLQHELQQWKQGIRTVWVRIEAVRPDVSVRLIREYNLKLNMTRGEQRVELSRSAYV
jgi:predicted patatin/cPLA2 family phospholipase